MKLMFSQPEKNSRSNLGIHRFQPMTCAELHQQCKTQSHEDLAEAKPQFLSQSDPMCYHPFLETNVSTSYSTPLDIAPPNAPAP